MAVTAGLFPEFEHLEAYASKSLQQDFESILRQFAADAQLDGTYFFCRQDSMAAAARLLARVEGLSLQVLHCRHAARVAHCPQRVAPLHYTGTAAHAISIISATSPETAGRRKCTLIKEMWGPSLYEHRALCLPHHGCFLCHPRP